MSKNPVNTPLFHDLALTAPVLKAVKNMGYETPSPIQAQIIPYMLAGKDVLGQAQTGTGKTAAFALPVLSQIIIQQKDPQVLVLAPTRELAIQVAEAFQGYATEIKGFHVLPIYGGQDYGIQLRQLKKGVHVVVGTPGRVMDHIRKGTLRLNQLTTLILDEADEMLRMGFIDDVEWVLEQIPQKKQIALFSATMPRIIRNIAAKYLCDPIQVTIQVKATHAENIRQRYWLGTGAHKLDALTRILEAEKFEGIIIFVRTKTTTIELTEKLKARGYCASAINGDISQQLRERAINHLKQGKLDILIATDVAARGLDVDRITHVINYDVPYDTESYIHRIGRTGRAGRTGDAILFISPRERRLLGNIERATKARVEQMQLPSTQHINNARIARFKQRITDTLATNELSFYMQLIEQYQTEYDMPATEIAAALAKIAQGSTPLLMQDAPQISHKERERHNNKNDRSAHNKDRKNRNSNRDRGRDRQLIKMDKYRIEVGNIHGVKPSNIVGAIANETGIDGSHIARIKIAENHSIVELPAGIPKELFQALKKIRVVGQMLNISLATQTLTVKTKPRTPPIAHTLKNPKAKKRTESVSRRNKNPIQSN